MSDPFDGLSFEEEINPEHWTEETRLHTPTFEALLKEDGTLWLSGPALQEGLSVDAVQALTRFRVTSMCSFHPWIHRMISQISHPGR